LTQQLLSDRKERLLISGLGERFITVVSIAAVIEETFSRIKEL